MLVLCPVRLFRLFSAALVESGFPFAKPIAYSLSQSENFTSAAGCSGSGGAIECLQQASLERLLKIEGAGGDPFTTPGWGYAIDTAPAPHASSSVPTVPTVAPIIPVDPVTLFRQNALVPNVTIAAGSNTDEVRPRTATLPSLQRSLCLNAVWLLCSVRFGVALQ